MLCTSAPPRRSGGLCIVKERPRTHEHHSIAGERGGKLKRLNEAFERFGDPARFFGEVANDRSR